MGRRLFAASIIGALLCSISFGATYGGGTGTSANPYQIWTPQQMNTIGANSADWGNCFILMADIDMSAYTGTQYNIIGNSITQFTGSFDGNGHKISNLTYTATSGLNYIGLFGYTSNVTINNLGIENANFSSHGRYVGSLVGYQSYGTIENCYSTGVIVSSYSGSSAASAGGLVGCQNYGTITNCYSTSLVTSASTAGGLVGQQGNGTIMNCYSTGSVTSASSYSSSYYSVCAGGMVGFLEAYGIITNCYSMGSVNSLSSAFSSSSSYAGGLVGYQAYNSTITYCHSTGSVTSSSSSSSYVSHSYAGGLVGKQNSGTITCCYSVGAITSTSSTTSSSAPYSYAGGLVGYQHYGGTITSCYSTGAVTSSSSSPYPFPYSCAGGLAGYQNIQGVIMNCYSTGSVTSSSSSSSTSSSSSPSSYAGGLTGHQNIQGVIMNCYSTGTVTISSTGKKFIGGLVGYGGDTFKSFWDTQTSGLTTSYGGTGVQGKTTAEMQTLSTFTDAGWDFVDTWYMNGYPHLQMEMEASGSQDGLIPLGFVIIQKTRIGRTTFEYELAVVVRNSNTFDMTNVQMKLKDWDTAVLSVSDDSVTIDTIPAGATVTSTDTFKIVVDRSTLIDSSKLAWILTYYVPAYGTEVQQATLSMLLSGIDAIAIPGDITGDGKVNLEDFVIMAQQWDDAPGNPSADIASPWGHVGIEDLIYLAENWLTEM